MSSNIFGVHSSHCCIEHGCKYAESDCPVELGMVEQKYSCEYCETDVKPEKIIIRYWDNKVPAQMAPDLIEKYSQNSVIFASQLMEFLNDVEKSGLSVMILNKNQSQSGKRLIYIDTRNFQKPYNR